MPSLPRLGLGTAALGVMDAPVEDAEAIAVVRAAFEAGIRLFDTAPLYGGGLAEERLGRALAGVDRSAICLATKTGVTRPYKQAAIPPGGSWRRAADVWDYSPEATRRSVARSLERLGTDRLDLVHLHDVEGRADESMAAYAILDAFRREGRVGGIGIGANRAEAALALIERARFDAVLIAGRYTLLDQSALAELLPRAQSEGIAVIVGGVFNSGILATGAQTGARFDYDAAPVASLERVRRIELVCRRHSVDLKAAALQFPSAHPAVTSLLIGPRSRAELQQNLAALQQPIPSAFWCDLRDEELVAPATPLPAAAA